MSTIRIVIIAIIVLSVIIVKTVGFMETVI